MKKRIILIGAGMLMLAGCTKKIADVGGAVGGVAGGLSGSSKDEAFRGTLMAAVKAGVPMKCTYRIGEMENEGWIQGKKYRGKMEQQGKVAEVIMVDNCMWSWSEEEGQGIKTCYESEEADETMWGDIDEADLPDSVEVPEVEYNCRPAVIGADKFTPPANIEFMDLDAMMQGAMQGEEFDMDQMMKMGQ